MPWETDATAKANFLGGDLAEDKVTDGVANSSVKHPRHVAIIMDGWKRALGA